MEISEQVKQIKRSFRLYMNGVTANSMRQKGLDYKVNWGVSQMDLRRMAAEYGKDRPLAEALWAESGVRECRLLATIIMPPEEMTVEHAMEWMAENVSVETVEAAVFNLFCHIPNADTLAKKLLHMPKSLARMGGYNLICLLLKRGAVFADSFYTDIFAVASNDLHIGDDRQLKHALLNCLVYISSLDIPQAAVADSMLASQE